MLNILGYLTAIAVGIAAAVIAVNVISIFIGLITDVSDEFDNNFSLFAVLLLFFGGMASLVVYVIYF